MRRAMGFLGLLVACKSQASIPPGAAVAPEPPTPPEEGAPKLPTASEPKASEAAEPAATVCKRDGECILSTFAGCCACCPGPARAFFKPELAKLEAKCQAVRCASCDQVCPSGADLRTYSALCESSRCVAEPN